MPIYLIAKIPSLSACMSLRSSRLDRLLFRNFPGDLLRSHPGDLDRAFRTTLSDSPLSVISFWGPSSSHSTFGSLDNFFLGGVGAFALQSSSSWLTGVRSSECPEPFLRAGLVGLSSKVLLSPNDGTVGVGWSSKTHRSSGRTRGLWEIWLQQVEPWLKADIGFFEDNKLRFEKGFLGEDALLMTCDCLPRFTIKLCTGDCRVMAEMADSVDNTDILDMGFGVALHGDWRRGIMQGRGIHRSLFCWLSGFILASRAIFLSLNRSLLAFSSFLFSSNNCFFMSRLLEHLDRYSSVLFSLLRLRSRTLKPLGLFDRPRCAMDSTDLLRVEELDFVSFIVGDFFWEEENELVFLTLVVLEKESFLRLSRNRWSRLLEREAWPSLLLLLDRCFASLLLLLDLLDLPRSFGESLSSSLSIISPSCPSSPGVGRGGGVFVMLVVAILVVIIAFAEKCLMDDGWWVMGG